MVMVILQKLQLRRAALEHTTAFSEVQKSKWREVLTSPKFMSSEESREELIDGKTNPILYVKPLPWRKACVTKFLKIMDEKQKLDSLNVPSDKVCQETLELYPLSLNQPLSFGEKFWGFA